MLALRRCFAPSRTAALARAYSDNSAGSAGSYRGDSQGDSFTKREKANEDYYVKQHEQEALKKLRAEIEKREKDLDDLKKKEHDITH